MINELISQLRTEGEELFYEFSSFLDKEEAEKASLIGLSSAIKNRIGIHEKAIKRQNNLLERANSYETTCAFERGYSSASINILNVQIETEKKYIKDLKTKLELVKYL